MGHLDRIKRGQGRLSNVLGRIRMFKNWYKVVMPFNRFFTGKQYLRLRNGKGAWVRDVRSMDFNIVRDILGGNEYHLEFIKLPNSATIIDLGGNIGTFCMEMHRQFPTAKLVAYEPFPSNVEMFKINAPFAVVHQKAASDKTGAVQFEVGDNFVGLRVLKDGGMTVESVSLDDIVKGYQVVDLLKVDIEGSEYAVLNAASKDTFAKVDRILMETHTVANFDDEAWANKILSENGFKVRWLETGIVYGEK